MSRLDINTVRLAAKNKWADILAKCGIERELLTKKGSACPICQDGEDRFTFDDKEGRGTWICRACGAGDGFKLLQAVKGWDFTKALREVAALAGEATPVMVRNGRDIEEVQAEIREIWKSGKPLTEVEAVHRWWLRRTGLPPESRELRAVRSLRCTGHADLPAMVALVRGLDGKVVNLHRTYVALDGQKPHDLPENRRVMDLTIPEGAAVQLSPAGDHLGVAEGIETAESCRIMFGIPTWALISARGVKTFTPPPQVKRITIFGDCDGSFTGQAAAFELARSLWSKRKKWTPELSVEVKVYGLTIDANAWDRDWNDAHALRRAIEGERGEGRSAA